MTCIFDGLQTTPPVEPSSYYETVNYEGVVVDDGRYVGYSFVDQHPDGRISDLYKATTAHVDTGPLRLNFGGNTFDDGQVYCDGVPLVAVALGKIVLPSGRMIIAWQDDTVYRYIHFAYSDTPYTRQFTGKYSYDFGGADISSPSPTTMVLMPSGKIKFYYYRLIGYGTGTPGAFKVGAFVIDVVGGMVTVTDEGEVIDTNNTPNTDPDYLEWRFHETGVEIIETDGTDANTKMIAIGRVEVPDEGSTFFKFYKSSNGGTTWIQDDTLDSGSFVNSAGATVSGPFSRALWYRFLNGNNPVWIRKFGNWVYVFAGVRNVAHQYRLTYTRATVQGAWRNRFDDWSTPVEMRIYNANTNGATRDCGYPCPFINKKSATDVDPQFIVRDYDTSMLANNGLADKRTQVYQMVVVGNYILPTGTIYSGLLSPGGGFWLGYTDSSSRSPEDAIGLSAGTFLGIEMMGYFKDEWILGPSTGTATVRNIQTGDVSDGIKISAHPDNPTGLVIENENADTGYFALNIRSTGDIAIKNLTIQNCRMGPQVETRLIGNYDTTGDFPATGAQDNYYNAAGVTYTWDVGTSAYVAMPFNITKTYQEVKLHDCTISNTWFEGAYLGSDVTSVIPTLIHVARCTFTNTGRDGLQCRNGSGLIEDVTITNAGTNDSGDHGHGITLGANSMGYQLSNCTVNSASNAGILCLALGYIEIHGTFHGDKIGLYISNYSSENNVFGATEIVVRIKAGTVITVGTAGAGYALEARRDATKLPMTIIIESGVTITGTELIEETLVGDVGGITLIDLRT